MAKPPAPTPTADLSAVVDFEVLRAQLVNCALLASQALNEANPGVDTRVLLSSFVGLGVLFTLRSASVGQRLYLLRLVNPDGSEASIARLDAAGEFEEFDEVDAAFIHAVGQSMPDTVCEAWTRMVPNDPTTTHPADYTLH